ncbi:HAD family hydrolase [Thiohalorhabdus sp. Cl-TMA]|uniref:HAD family hydrolase n=1 Tax=Thiohalorhabdus methylotrophus TaxID=3242694 RepID=A0ABV4U076_9GAMM
MQQAAIEWVLLDYGGVVADEGLKAGLQALARHHGLDPEQVTSHSTDAVYDSGYVTGTGSEADFWRILGERTGLWVEPLEGADAVLPRFRLRSWMLAWVRRLREAGIRVGLLTDQTDWLQRLDRRDGFLAEFDRVYNSYRMGKGKQDPTLFDDVVADLGVDPGRVLFIDDASGHVERARSRGLQARMYEERAAVEQALEAVRANAGGGKDR